MLGACFTVSRPVLKGVRAGRARPSLCSHRVVLPAGHGPDRPRRLSWEGETAKPLLATAAKEGKSGLRGPEAWPHRSRRSWEPVTARSQPARAGGMAPSLGPTRADACPRPCLTPSPARWGQVSGESPERAARAEPWVSLRSGGTGSVHLCPSGHSARCSAPSFSATRPSRRHALGRARVSRSAGPRFVA